MRFWGSYMLGCWLMVWVVFAQGKPEERVEENALSFKALFGPNATYDYLEGVERYPFDEDASAESLRNAWWLARLSMLVYVEDEDFLKAEAGICEDSVQVLEVEGRLRGIALKMDGSVVFVFQGTRPNQLADWLTDLSVVKREWEGGGRVHGGFFDLAEMLQPEVERVLEEWDEEGGSLRIWFAGHSMGGAVATLMGAKYEERLAGIYTFGAPRVGNRMFCDVHGSLPLYRFVNDNDLIARLPTPPGYRHTGALVVIQSSGDLLRDPDFGEQMRARWDGHREHLREVFGEHWKEQDFRAIPSDYLVDHSPLRYVEFLKAYR